MELTFVALLLGGTGETGGLGPRSVRDGETGEQLEGQENFACQELLRGGPERLLSGFLGLDEISVAAGELRADQQRPRPQVMAVDEFRNRCVAVESVLGALDVAQRQRRLSRVPSGENATACTSDVDSILTAFALRSARSTTVTNSRSPIASLAPFSVARSSITSVVTGMDRVTVPSSRNTSTAPARAAAHECWSTHVIAP